MSLIKAKEAREKRAQAIEAMRNIQKDYSDNWTDEAQAKWDKAEADEKRFLSDANRYEKLAAIESEQRAAQTTNLSDKPKADSQEERSAKYRESFFRYMKSGKNQLAEQDRAVIVAGESRNNTVSGNGTQGGFLVPEGFSNELEKFMKFYGGMMEVSRVMNTATGNDIPYPRLDDTANVGALISEAVADSNLSLGFTSKTLGSYTYTSRMLPVSMELLQDSYFDVQSIVSEAAGERIGRILNTHFTTGTGVAQPEGVVTASAQGVAAASATALTRAEIVDLIHSVDRAYRMSPNTRFMFNDSTLAAIKKLAFGSADDRPLWQPSIRVGEPDRLEGFQYTVNNDMAVIGTGAKTVLFGDFNKYIIRQARRPELVVSTEKLIDQRMTVFYVFARYDGKLINENAIKHLVQA